MNKKDGTLKILFIIITVFFGLFLALPLIMILIKSITGESGIDFGIYRELITDKGLGEAFINSVWVSLVSGMIATTLGFLIAYSINYTDINSKFKKVLAGLTVLPMLLPTITYGFAIIYSFGKQGLVTTILGVQLFDIYSPIGLIYGYVIYTLPIAFLLINNTMKYIDKKFLIVSRAMGDTPFRSFRTNVIRPLLGTLAAALIQSFTMCFTDYGIPASVGGDIELVANMLYSEMLGSIPDFNAGSAVAISMLIPAVLSIILITYISRYNIRYNKISQIELQKNKGRDISFGVLSSIVLFAVISVFFIIFIVPFVEQWPYRINFTTEHVISIFGDPAVMDVYKNSLIVALLSAVFGTLIVYSAALISARNSHLKKFVKVLDSIALVSNTVPGMVIGVAFLLTFVGTPIQNTFAIIIIANIIHFFSSPYLMMKGSLEKLNPSWETTAKIMGDSWLKTVVRIITPNAKASLIEAFSYYFVNSMVTISAVIFIAGASTMVITAKIKELQHFANYNEIFVLSILILVTNLIAKLLFKIVEKKKERRGRGED